MHALGQLVAHIGQVALRALLAGVVLAATESLAIVVTGGRLDGAGLLRLATTFTAACALVDVVVEGVVRGAERVLLSRRRDLAALLDVPPSRGLVAALALLACAGQAALFAWGGAFAPGRAAGGLALLVGVVLLACLAARGLTRRWEPGADARGLALVGLVLAVPLALDGWHAHGAVSLATHSRGSYRLVWDAIDPHLSWGRERVALAMIARGPHGVVRERLEHGPVERQLERLAELVDRLERGAPGRAGGTSAGVGMGEGSSPHGGDLRGDGAAGDDPVVAVRGSELDLVAARLARQLHRLEPLLLGDEAGAAPGNRRSDIEVREVLSRATGTLTRGVHLIDAEAVENLAVEFVNEGEAPVHDPRLVLNGERDWFDVAAVVAEATAGCRDDASRARALWEFLVRHRFHSEPAHGKEENHDPVKLLNVYGYGFCDDAARAWVRLARAAGLRARLWGLGGHVVAEAFHDGAWHAYDPDAQVLFRDASGAVASVVTLAEAPELLRDPITVPGFPPQYAEALLAGFYGSTHDNHVSRYQPSGSEHDMGFTLGPGETLRLAWGHDGLRVADGFWRVPARFGNGTWSAERPLGDGVTWEVELPWPLLDGEVELVPAAPGQVSAAESGAPPAGGPDASWAAGPGQPPEVVVEVRTASGLWTPVSLEPSRGSAAGARPASPRLPGGRSSSGSAPGREVEAESALFVAHLSPLLHRGWGDPDYALGLRVRPAAGVDPGTDPGAERGAWVVRVRLVVQVAPASLPALEPGQNTWELRTRGAGTALLVRHLWASR